MNKYINILITNFFFLIIFYYLIELYYYKYHKFWGIQPISKYNLLKFKDGIISFNKPPKIIESKNFTIRKINLLDDHEINNIKIFLNENYSDSQFWNYNYSKEYINHLFNSYKKDKINLILKNSLSKIVGFISSKPQTIILKGTKIISLYADYLCICKDYRHKNLAAIIISNFTNEAYKIGYNVIIFRKDNIPLPFRFITHFENKIYYLPNGKLNHKKIIKANINEFNLIYNFYRSQIEKYNSYISYSPIDFKYYFFNEYVDIWYDKDENNNLCNFLVGNNNQSLVNNENIIDIPFIFINNQELSIDFFNNILFYYKSKKFTYCNINNFSKSYYFLERNLDIYKIYSTYIQMYNYHILYPLTKSNLYFL